MTYRIGTHLLDPNYIFEKSHLRSGMVAGDFGCGKTGHFVLPASKYVGENGLVYAVDVLREALDELKNLRDHHNINNIHLVWSDLEKIGGTAIPEKSLDMAFIVNSLVYSVNREFFLEEVARLMKRKSRLVVVDWDRKGLSFGPESEKHINFEALKRWGAKKNFAVQEEFFAGPFHKGVVFFKYE